MGDGSVPEQGFMSKLFSAGKRMISGESLIMTHFTNCGHGKKRVAFASPFPGSILPLNMDKLGGSIYLQKDSFLCAALGTKVDIAFQRKLGASFFGGEGFILEHLQGDGMAFAHAGGTVIHKQLNNETLKLDTGCVVGFSEGIEFDIERVSGLKSMFFGGRDYFLRLYRALGQYGSKVYRFLDLPIE